MSSRKEPSTHRQKILFVKIFTSLKKNEQTKRNKKGEEGWGGWNGHKIKRSISILKCTSRKKRRSRKRSRKGYIYTDTYTHTHTHTHKAHTPSRRRLRLRGAYQPPSIISMRISIFHPVFPKFMQTSNPFRWPPKLIPLLKPKTAFPLSLFLSFTSISSVLVTVLYYIVVCLQNGGYNRRVWGDVRGMDWMGTDSLAHSSNEGTTRARYRVTPLRYGVHQKMRKIRTPDKRVFRRKVFKEQKF